MSAIIRRRIVVVFATILVAAACSSAGDEPSTTVTTSGATETTTTTAVTESEASGAVSSLKAVKSAVVRIVAQGSFVDPEEGMIYNAAGSGSGFIIDPSGLAVTNNH